MDFKKKISCLILACIMVFAGSALCALGVGATDYYTPSGYSIMGLGTNTTVVSLPTSKTNTITTTRQFNFRTDYSPSLLADDYYIEIEFSLPFLIEFSAPPSGSITSNTILVGQTQGNNGFAPLISDFSSSSYPGVTGFWYNISFNLALNTSISHLYLTVFLKNQSIYQDDVINWDSFLIATDYDPDPPIPPSDQFTPVEYGTFFMNSKLSDVSAWSYRNDVFGSIPFKKYVYENNPFDIYTGCLISNWSDVFRANTVIQGEVWLSIADPMGIQASADPVFSHALPVFVSTTEPSDSNFQYSFVPQSWTSQIDAYRIPLNTFGYNYVVTFYIVVPPDYLNYFSFTPVDLCFYYNNYHPASTGKFVTMLYKYDLSYYYLGSDGSADLPYNPNQGVPDTVITPTDVNSVEMQTEWLTQQYNEDDSRYQALQSSLDSSLSNINFHLYISALEDLAEVCNSTGTAFEFKLPRATIPAISDLVPQTQLWDNTTIPFKQYVDALPIQYKKIIGYLVLLSAGSVVVGSFGLLFRKLLRKDVSM